MFQFAIFLVNVLRSAPLSVILESAVRNAL
jgi:hypothetical protein